MLLVTVVSAGAVVAQDDEVTLQLWGASSSEAENAAVEAQVAAFEEANPGIDVEITWSPEYEATIQKARKRTAELVAAGRLAEDLGLRERADWEK